MKFLSLLVIAFCVSTSLAGSPRQLAACMMRANTPADQKRCLGVKEAKAQVLSAIKSQEDKAKKLTQDYAKEMTEIKNNLVEATKKLKAGFAKRRLNLTNVSGTTIQQRLKALMDRLKDAIPGGNQDENSKDFWKNKFEDVIKKIEDQFSSLGEDATATITRMREQFAQIQDTMNTNRLHALEQFNLWFNSVMAQLNRLTTAVKSMRDNVLEGLQTRYNGMAETAADFVEKFKNWKKEVDLEAEFNAKIAEWNQMRQDLQKKIGDEVNKVDWEQAQKDAGEKLENIKEAFSAKVVELKDKMVQQYEKLPQATKEKCKGAMDKINEWNDQFKGHAANGIGKLMEILGELKEAMES